MKPLRRLVLATVGFTSLMCAGTFTFPANPTRIPHLDAESIAERRNCVLVAPPPALMATLVCR